MKKIVFIMIILFMSVTMLYSPTVYAVGQGIVLDGYFDDWADKPAQTIKYGWNNPGQYSTVKWYSDDKNLYLYIKMGEAGYSQLSNNYIYYYVDNGSKQGFNLAPDNPSKGKASVYNYNIDYKPFSDDGCLVRGGSNGIKGDQVEFRVPLTMFQKSGSNNISNIRMEFPDLGDQSISFEVGSTYPYMGIAICSTVAALGFFIYIRKRRRIL